MTIHIQSTEFVLGKEVWYKCSEGADQYIQFQLGENGEQITLQQGSLHHEKQQIFKEHQLYWGYFSG
jgi:hypothetical protein